MGSYGQEWRNPVQTAAQVIDVVPVGRSLDPRTLSVVISQAYVEQYRRKHKI
ncbi:MAG: hypothetical protein M1493_03495 [Firmicutes bacterium]|jgi:hypothetical protein|nr:hypothetical protein [Bacillota bacterium]